MNWSPSPSHLAVTKNTRAECRLEPRMSCYVPVSKYMQVPSFYPGMEVKRKYTILFPGPHAIIGWVRDTVQLLQGSA